MKDDRVYLKHILECIGAIGQYTAAGRDRFLFDRMTQKATLRELQELSESVQRLSGDIKARRPEIPWREIGGFRNVIVHDYLGLNVFRVWDIVDSDLPKLRESVDSLLRELS